MSELKLASKARLGAGWSDLTFSTAGPVSWILVGMAAGVDIADAIARFRAAVDQIPNVATDPAPQVNLLDLNLIGPVISVRPFTHTNHYWQVYFDTNEAITRVAKEAGWPAPMQGSSMRSVGKALIDGAER